jgi:hypothetical protein
VALVPVGESGLGVAPAADLLGDSIEVDHQ